MKITFIEHSGFMVEMEHTVLLFDYYQGKIPTFDKNKTLYVFVSHSHADHYNPVIWKLKEQYEKVQYIISDDVKTKENALRMKPHEKKQISEMTVETLKSNDMGVAYIVEVEGKVIYHAGDLNWWHWEGEPEAYNIKMADDYKKQIDLLAGERIDLAFVPLDPRQERQYDWGVKYLLERNNVPYVVPMHFWNQPDVIDRLLVEPYMSCHANRICPLRHRGQYLEFS